MPCGHDTSTPLLGASSDCMPWCEACQAKQPNATHPIPSALRRVHVGIQRDCQGVIRVLLREPPDRLRLLQVLARGAPLALELEQVCLERERGNWVQLRIYLGVDLGHERWDGGGAGA